MNLIAWAADGDEPPGVAITGWPQDRTADRLRPEGEVRLERGSIAGAHVVGDQAVSVKAERQFGLLRRASRVRDFGVPQGEWKILPPAIKLQDGGS